MNHKDRFYSTIHYQPVDRPASWMGLPVPAAEPALMKYFGVTGMDELRAVIDFLAQPRSHFAGYTPANIKALFNAINL